MTPESQSNPLLDNSLLTHVSASKDNLVETEALTTELTHVSATSDKHATT
jgi:hypothetical protein